MSVAAPPLPSLTAGWQEWVAYGQLWAARAAVLPAGQSHQAGRTLTWHAYREATPGPRWRALFEATWPAYRAWYLSEGDAARPSLAECAEALQRYLPELVPTWRALSELADDEVAARMLTGWRLPAFAVNCSQVIVPGPRPTLLRNYDYDPDLFEAVIASTNYSGDRAVLGTSDLLWGLLDGMNDAGLAVSLTYGGRGVVGEGFGIPIVIRYLLQTCADVAEATAALARIPVSQSYNLALADTSGAHATVFVAPGVPAEVSRLEASTNHFLDTVERPEHARRFRSVERQQRLLDLRAEDAEAPDLVAALLAAPLRAEEWDSGFGTLYTVCYSPAEGRATWHWPGQEWSRGFEDAEEQRSVRLTSGGDS